MKCFFHDAQAPKWVTPCTEGGKVSREVEVGMHAPVKVCKGHAREMMYSKKQVEAVNPGARMTIRDTVRREGR